MLYFLIFNKYIVKLLKLNKMHIEFQAIKGKKFKNLG